MHQATEIDPGYADAWQLQARILRQLGRVDEQLVALEACLKVAPGAVDCMQERVVAFRNVGQCSDGAAEARRWISWEPEESPPYRQLAFCLAADHASRATVEEVLNLSWNRLLEEDRPTARLFEHSQLAAWMGDFDDALRESDELEQAVLGSAAGESHWHAALNLVDVHLEWGQPARAAAIAERALARKDVWVKGNSHTEDLVYKEPIFRATELLAGRITLAQWRDASDAWERTNAVRVGPFERWVLRWGTIAAGAIDEQVGEGSRVRSKIDLAEAMRHVPKDDLGGIDEIGAMNSGYHGHVLDAYEGRLRMFTGEMARAASLLESAARACHSLDFPFLNVRAHLWLGMAREKLGDTEAACEAYQFVLERWGHAKPASATAREAERHARNLACK